MNFENVTIRQFMVGTNNTSRTPVNTSNKPGFKVRVNATGEGFGMKSRRYHEGIGQHATITVHPMCFILNRIDHNVLQSVKQHGIHELC